MTTNDVPKNRVVIYGIIDEQRAWPSRDGSPARAPRPAIRTFRNPAGGATYHVGLQVASPHGGSYQLEVEIGHVAGAEVLATAQAGQTLVVTGSVSRGRTVDKRFRDYAEDLIEGVVYRDMHVETLHLRMRNADDPSGTGSNVALEGQVLEPPYFLRHPDHPEIELARVILKTRTQPHLDAEGVVLGSLPAEVAVIIPVDDPAAGLLYRRGNWVRVRGALDRLAVREPNRGLVRDRLEELSETFEETRAAAAVAAYRQGNAEGWIATDPTTGEPTGEIFDGAGRVREG